MVLLDGTTTLRDLQMALMRQRGGMLVSSDEVESVVAHLDDSFLLESAKFKKAKDRVVEEFVSMKVRPCSHSIRAYPVIPASSSESWMKSWPSSPIPKNPKESFWPLWLLTLTCLWEGGCTRGPIRS